ncbi:hypothetical protein KJ359_009561 [Pestalotiopsis sp. 9143b]|nr:hypothetical protein KJ359_009561 [Pestalotiopsis sp. 9143b]
MSSLGEKIKAVFSSGSHSTEAEKGLVDHRTPGAFPVEESDTTGQHQTVAGTSSELDKDHHEHNKLHKKGDPRGYTGLVGEEGASGHKHADNVTGLDEQRYVQQDTAAKNAPTTISSQPSTHNTSLATDQANRPDTSAVPGTGAVAAGAGGVAARELGEDRSGQKPSALNTSSQDTLGQTSDLPTNISRDNYTGTTGRDTVGRDTLGSNTLGSTTGRDTLGSNTLGSTTGRDTLGTTTGRDTVGSNTLGDSTPGRDTTGLGTGRDATGSSVTGTTGSGRETTESHSHSAATAGAVGAGALAGHELNRGADSRTGTSTDQTEEPYWGDLPQGTGVYNTVTGHGSGEDTSVQHRTVPKPAGDASSPHSTVTGNTTDRLGYGSGVYNTVVGHGSNDEHTRAHHTDDGQRAFPLNEHGNTETTSRDPQHKDRHLGEAGAAMGAGAAAYGAAEHHKHSKDKSSQLPSEKAGHEGLAHRPADQPRDAAASHGTGILHRHKDDVDETKPKHVGVSSSSDHPQETYDNTGRHHNNKILGFMHSRKDEENARSQTSDAGTHHGKDPLASGSHDRSLNEDHSHRDRNAALTGAGVGAAAATGYGVSHAQKHHDQTGSPAQYQGQQGSVASNAQNPTSGNIGQPGAYAQNPTSGNIGQSGAYTQNPTTGNTAGQPGAYTQNPVSGNVTGQPTGYAQSPASGNIAGQPGAYNTSQLDSSRTAPTATHGSHIGAGQTAGLAGAGAAAAGYGASKLGQHDTANAPPTATGQDSYGHLPSGTSSGIAPEARGQERTSASGLGGQTGTSHGVAGGHSHGDQYNVLSSGTPSGVQVESTPTKATGAGVRGTPGQSMGTGASGASFGQPGSHVTQECTKCGTTK